ncbi:hypothetical protein AB1Y20_003697 [Prymnesium parvum]|uniref:F-box domain-containing protein n=1 Tax=Prymnesium parvum TaxID=97485 RepID=A0AB34J5G6_PRYPA
MYEASAFDALPGLHSDNPSDATSHLLRLSDDCLFAVIMHCDAEELISLRACCTLLRTATRDPSLLRKWRAAHAREHRAYLEMKRLSRHYASLDEESLEVELKSPERLPPPPLPIRRVTVVREDGTSSDDAAHVAPSGPSSNAAHGESHSAPAGSSCEAGASSHHAHATFQTTRVLLEAQLKEGQLRQTNTQRNPKARKAVRRSYDADIAMLEAQRLYYESVDEWVLEIDH